MKKVTCYILLVLALPLFLFPACVKENEEKISEAVGAETVNQTEKMEPVGNGEPDSKASAFQVTTDSDKNKNTNDSSNAAKIPKIHYIITQNYGVEMVLAKQILYQKNGSIMDGLFESGAEVETAYGGGFISSINGLKSAAGMSGGVRKDWFYFVNGIFADSGALDYLPEPGEKIWWDYHPWKTSQGTSAVIGCFPEPFLHGYRQKVKETVILTMAEEREKGEALQKALRTYGVVEVAVKEINPSLLEKRAGPTIIIGQWPELEKIQWLRKFNEAYQRNGVYLHFTDEGLELMNYRGEGVGLVRDKAGVICATGEGNGDDSPLWIITGTDRSGTEAALELLIRHPEKIQAAYGVAVLPGEVIKLPVMRQENVNQ